MKNKKITLRNITLAVHILGTALWLGGAVTIPVLLFSALNNTNNHSVNLIQQLILRVQLFVMLPGAAAVIITGFILSLRSQWGLIKYKWIIFKLFGTAALIILEANLNQRFIRNAVKLTEDFTKSALLNSSYIYDRNMIFILIIAEIIVLMLIVAVSVIKPGGKRKRKINKINSEAV